MGHFLSLVTVGLMIGCVPLQQQRPRASHVFRPPPRAIPVTTSPSPRRRPRVKKTIEASWYGERHHGKRTASGESFNMYAMTAAHKTLRLGTRVRITHPRTGRSVTVRINDRCGRSGKIDLSKAAAEVIGLVREGRAKVKMTILN